ncbi:unnamed protein product [Prunus armeniaca]
MNAYKLGYLDCSNGNDPFYAVGDGDIEMLCGRRGIAEEDEAEEDATDKVVTDIADQAGGAAENVADQANVEEAVDQGSPAGISE